MSMDDDQAILARGSHRERTTSNVSATMTTSKPSTSSKHSGSNKITIQIKNNSSTSTNSASNIITTTASSSSRTKKKLNTAGPANIGVVLPNNQQERSRIMMRFMDHKPEKSIGNKEGDGIVATTTTTAASSTTTTKKPNTPIALLDDSDDSNKFEFYEDFDEDEEFKAILTLDKDDPIYSLKHTFGDPDDTMPMDSETSSSSSSSRTSGMYEDPGFEFEEDYEDSDVNINSITGSDHLVRGEREPAGFVFKDNDKNKERSVDHWYKAITSTIAGKQGMQEQDLSATSASASSRTSRNTNNTRDPPPLHPVEKESSVSSSSRSQSQSQSQSHSQSTLKTSSSSAGSGATPFLLQHVPNARELVMRENTKHSSSTGDGHTVGLFDSFSSESSGDDDEEDDDEEAYDRLRRRTTNLSSKKQSSTKNKINDNKNKINDNNHNHNHNQHSDDDEDAYTYDGSWTSNSTHPRHAAVSCKAAFDELAELFPLSATANLEKSFEAAHEELLVFGCKEGFASAARCPRGVLASDSDTDADPYADDDDDTYRTFETLEKEKESCDEEDNNDNEEEEDNNSKGKPTLASKWKTKKESLKLQQPPKQQDSPKAASRGKHSFSKQLPRQRKGQKRGLSSLKSVNHLSPKPQHEELELQLPQHLKQDEVAIKAWKSKSRSKNKSKSKTKVAPLPWPESEPVVQPPSKVQKFSRWWKEQKETHRTGASGCEGYAQLGDLEDPTAGDGSGSGMKSSLQENEDPKTIPNSSDESSNSNSDQVDEETAHQPLLSQVYESALGRCTTPTSDSTGNKNKRSTNAVSAAVMKTLKWNYESSCTVDKAQGIEGDAGDAERSVNADHKDKHKDKENEPTDPNNNNNNSTDFYVDMDDAALLQASAKNEANVVLKVKSPIQHMASIARKRKHSGNSSSGVSSISMSSNESAKSATPARMLFSAVRPRAKQAQPQPQAPSGGGSSNNDIRTSPTRSKKWISLKKKSKQKQSDETKNVNYTREGLFPYDEDGEEDNVLLVARDRDSVNVNANVKDNSNQETSSIDGDQSSKLIITSTAAAAAAATAEAGPQSQSLTSAKPPLPPPFVERTPYRVPEEPFYHDRVEVVVKKRAMPPPDAEPQVQQQQQQQQAPSSSVSVSPSTASNSIAESIEIAVDRGMASANAATATCNLAESIETAEQFLSETIPAAIVDSLEKAERLLSESMYGPFDEEIFDEQAEAEAEVSGDNEERVELLVEPDELYQTASLSTNSDPMRGLTKDAFVISEPLDEMNGTEVVVVAKTKTNKPRSSGKPKRAWWSRSKKNKNTVKITEEKLSTRLEGTPSFEMELTNPSDEDDADVDTMQVSLATTTAAKPKPRPTSLSPPRPKSLASKNNLQRRTRTYDQPLILEVKSSHTASGITTAESSTFDHDEEESWIALSRGKTPSPVRSVGNNKGASASAYPTRSREVSGASGSLSKDAAGPHDEKKRTTSDKDKDKKKTKKSKPRLFSKLNPWSKRGSGSDSSQKPTQSAGLVQGKGGRQVGWA